MILGEFSHIRKGGNYERTPQKQPEKKEAIREDRLLEFRETFIEDYYGKNTK